MSEQLSSCCLFEGIRASRYPAVTRLFEADPRWMGQPSTFIIYNSNEILTEAAWSRDNPEIERPLENLFLAVYSHIDTSHPFRSAIVLEESDGRAVYTLSFPVAVLQQQSIDEAERRFVEIYRAAATLGPCSLFVGAEAEVTPQQSKLEAIARACESSSLVTWMVLASGELPTPFTPFAIAAQDECAVLLRHPDANTRIRFDRS